MVRLPMQTLREQARSQTRELDRGEREMCRQIPGLKYFEELPVSGCLDRVDPECLQVSLRSRAAFGPAPGCKQPPSSGCEARPWQAWIRGREARKYMHRPDKATVPLNPVAHPRKCWCWHPLLPMMRPACRQLDIYSGRPTVFAGRRGKSF